MKKNFFEIKTTGLLLFCALFAQTLFAQNSNQLGTDEFPRSNIGVGVGTNVFMLFNNGEDFISQSDSVKWGKVNFYASPTFNLNYDYAITSVFSLGIAVGRNRLGFDFTELDYTSGDGQTFIRGDIDARLTRTSVTLRPLFHYGRTEKLDMYSGARIGGAWWGVKFIGEGEAKAKDEFQKSFSGKFGRAGTLVPNAGLTLFGINYYPIENLGFGAELNVGQPYGFAASVNYRF